MMIRYIKRQFIKYAKKRIIRFSEEKEDYLIFFEMEGIGDMCYSLAFLDEIKARKNKKILLVTTKYLAEIATCFKSIDDIITIPRKQFVTLDRVFAYGREILYNGDNDSRLYYFPHWRFFDFYVLRLPQVDYIKLQRYVIYNLDETASITYPVIEDCSMEKYNYMPFENAAIINPYSNYLSQEDKSIFDSISEYLSNKGIKAYTNVVGDQQPLQYSESLHCSVEDLYRLSKRVRVLISIRSGICDFVVNSGGNMIVIYPENSEHDRLFRKSYTLSAWEGDSNIFEFNDKQKDDILLKLKELFGR